MAHVATKYIIYFTFDIFSKLFDSLMLIWCHCVLSIWLRLTHDFFLLISFFILTFSMADDISNDRLISFDTFKPFSTHAFWHIHCCIWYSMILSYYSLFVHCLVLMILMKLYYLLMLSIIVCYDIDKYVVFDILLLMSLLFNDIFNFFFFFFFFFFLSVFDGIICCVTCYVCWHSAFVLFVWKCCLFFCVTILLSLHSLLTHSSVVDIVSVVISSVILALLVFWKTLTVSSIIVVMLCPLSLNVS